MSIGCGLFSFSIYKVLGGTRRTETRIEQFRLFSFNKNMNKFHLKFMLLCLFSFVGMTLCATDFTVSGINYNKLTSTTVEVCSGSYSIDIIIPSKVTNEGFTYNVTKIGDKAFYQSSSLTSIIIPHSITEIGEYAFNGCSKMTSILFGNSVANIDRHAFDYCISLTTISLPSSLTSIEANAFESCSQLTAISILDGVTKIGESALCIAGFYHW